MPYLDSKISSTIIFEAAPNIVRFPAIVEAIAKVIHEATLSPVKPVLCIYRIMSLTAGTLLSTWLSVKEAKVIEASESFRLSLPLI